MSEAICSKWNPLGSVDTYAGPPLPNWQQKSIKAWKNLNDRRVVEAITDTGKSLVGIAAIREVVLFQVLHLLKRQQFAPLEL